jgi:hypothetical protein
MDLSVFLIVLFLTLPIYFISKRIFKNKITNAKKRIFFSFLTTIILSSIIYVLAIVSIICLQPIEITKDFDETVWKSNNSVDSKMKNYEMIDDLIDKKLLIGKDTLKVKEMLGTPYANVKEINVWSYDAGTSTGFGFVDHYLNVYFKDGKVFEVMHERSKD